MTEKTNLPATMSQTTSLFPSREQWSMIQEQAKVLVKTGMLPETIKRPEQAIAIMLKGRELDVPPLQAFSQINVIKGKPTLSPELMLGLIYQRVPGTVIHYEQNDDKACRIKVTRPGHQPQEFGFSMEDAKTAGLSTKHNWKTYPRAMLRSRAISEMARALFPDAVSGCGYTAEEISPDSTVNEEGDIIKIDPALQQPVRETQSFDGPEVQTDANAQKGLSDSQLAELGDLIKSAGWSRDDARKVCESAWGVKSSIDLDDNQYQLLCGTLKQGKTADEVLKELV